MRYVKIGDSYFNPMRIDRIKAAAEKNVNSYIPIVKVYLVGKTFHYDATDLDMHLVPMEFDEEWAALGAADAMAEMVRKDIEGALNG